jgi:salicylate hydroxylase
MAIEDAYLLGHIFGSLTTAEEINGAFTIFDELRRPRCQQIVDDGRRTGLLFCGQDKAAGVNAKKLGEALVPLFGHLGDINFESLKQKALKMLYDKKS